MVDMKGTLKGMRVNLGWSQKRLSLESGIDCGTISRTERGACIGAEKAKKLADAFSRGYGREILPLDIEGLVIE